MVLKRLLAPDFWKIEKKKFKYVIEPLPGAHAKDFCIPLAIIIRDILKIADTLKEAKNVIHSGKIKVDGKIVKEYRYPCGLYDVISFDSEFYRIVPFKNGLTLKKIEEKEANLKICKVKNKTKISINKYQLTLHDGKNILTENNEIKVHDSLLIEIPNLKVLEHIKFEKGVNAVVFRGRNSGFMGKIEEIYPGDMLKDWTVKISNNEKTVLSIRDYVIAVGKEIKITVI